MPSTKRKFPRAARPTDPVEPIATNENGDEHAPVEAPSLKSIATNMLRLARDEPLLFQEKFLGMRNDPWQKDATEAVWDAIRSRYGKPTRVNHEGLNYVSCCAMHGPGKTYWLAGLALTFAFAFPKARIPCIAPKMDQLKTRLWFEMRKIRDSANPVLRDAIDIGSVTARFFGMDDWIAFGQTATKAENLAGLHNDFILVLVDEASGVPEHLWPAIFGAVSTGKVPILAMISNPTRNTGTFADSWLKAEEQKKYWRVKISLDKAPRVSASWVEAMRTKYGETSPIFKIRCLGEFAESGDRQLIPLQWIHDAFDNAPLEQFADGSRARIRVSVDVADGGVDETVFTVGVHYDSCEVIVKVKRASYASSIAPIRAAQEAAVLFTSWGGVKGEDDFVVDSLGVGAGTAGHLLDEGHSVITYKGGEGSADSKKWRNRRVQTYISLRDALRQQRVIVLESAFDSDTDKEDFIAQLCCIETNPGTERVEDLVTKEQMVRNGLKSPDIADSLAMQYATQVPTLLSRDAATERQMAETYVVESEAPSW